MPLPKRQYGIYSTSQIDSISLYNLSGGFHWCFDNGNLSERNGSGHNAINYGSSQATDQDGLNSAYDFDNTDYMKIPDHSDFDFGSSDFTVSAWAKKTANTTNWNGNVVINKWRTGSSPGTNEWYLSIASGAQGTSPPAFIIESGTTRYKADAQTQVVLGQWYHLVGKREGDSIKIYVNGIEEGRKYIGNVSVNNVGRDVLIGKIFSGYYAKSIIDDISIYNRSLSEQEIQALYSRQYRCEGEAVAVANGNSGEYRFGFSGYERDDEVAGSGNHYSFSSYGYDPRLGRRWRTDPKAAMLPHLSPYLYGLNNPINVIDPDGEFPILINGRVGSDSERGSSTYWASSVRNTISTRTGYSQSAFMYVDGDQGFWASTRREAGSMQAKVDAQQVWNRMKESINEEGQITEQLQVVTHSRGSAYGQGYMETMAAEIKALAKEEGIGFAYDEGSIVEYSVNLAPHQSNSINYPNSGAKNVNISHVGDPLSGNDASGDVINVHSIPEEDAFDQHGNATYNTELDAVLETLEGNTDKGKLLNEIKTDYKEYDNSRTNGGTSSVKKGG